MPVDVGLARLSNDLIAGGIVAYSVAFLGFALEAAFGEGFDKQASATAKQAIVPAQVPALDGASANDSLPRRTTAAPLAGAGAWIGLCRICCRQRLPAPCPMPAWSD